MKTTLDIPDPLFRQAKSRAALRGISLRQFFTEALEEKITASPSAQPGSAEPPWMRGFGALRDLHEETRVLDSRIAEAFDRLEEEDRG